MNNYNNKRTNNNIYTIPVVVHVLYNTLDQNISDAQITSQINILNEDFRRMNIDTINTPSDFLQYAADCKIEFCLAQRDPENNPTNGITRTSTNEYDFNISEKKIYYDSLGGKNAWNSNKYLNIWVAKINNLAGYSTFPGYPFEEEDGVVINYEYFGNIGTATPPFNKGRTATHEVGHWLNLIHIWGDMNCGDDFVNDTPTQQEANFGCPSHPHPSCNNNGDMFQNYMDYSNDGCMNMFTTGQKNRMIATLDTIRTQITSCNNACILPLEDAGIINIVNISNNEQICNSEINPIIEIKNFSTEPLFCLDIEYFLDNLSYSYSWQGELNYLESELIYLPSITNIPDGNHEIIVYSINPNNAIDQNLYNDSLNIEFNTFSGDLIEININTDNYGDEIFWRIVDENDSTWYSDSNLPDNMLVNYSICLSDSICYDFIIEDTYNDGICCQFGNGYIEINNNLYSGEYNSQLIIPNLNCNNLHAESNTQKEFKIFPNPSNGKISIITEPFNGEIRYNINDIYGKIIKKGEIRNKNSIININNKGVYFISFFHKNDIITKKIIIN
tara:strand:- start:1148 stop:2824 length:1677 start_codon:yes stop_codon:yes gene_type:complete